jgi:hypothetical protein
LIFTGTGAESIYIWGADLRVANESNALPPYQRVVTATDYDTTGFPAYLRFDNDALVTNSIDFSTGATNPPLGPDLILNGDFDTASNWLLGAGVSITGGEAVFASVATGASRLYQQNTLGGSPAGRRFRITYTVAVTSGSVRALIGGGAGTYGAIRTASGTYTEDMTVGSSVTANQFEIYVQSTFTGTIDNVSVKEVDANYLPDRMSVFAGVRKLSDAATAIVVELATAPSTNPGAFYLAAPRNASTANYAFSSSGTVEANPTSPASYAAPITNVMSGLGDISADSAILRLNGVQAAQITTDQGTGNYGNYPLYIGSRGGTTLPFTGRLHSLIVLGRTVTPTELTQTEGYVETKTFGKDMAYVFYEVLNGPDGDQLTVTAGGDDLYVYKQYE